MQAVIWVGSALTLGGVGLLVYCIMYVAKARRAGLDDLTLRTRLQKAVGLNLAALALSGIGLIVVIVGLALN
jgi:hypothetical protein